MVHIKVDLSTKWCVILAHKPYKSMTPHWGHTFVRLVCWALLFNLVNYSKTSPINMKLIHYIYITLFFDYIMCAIKTSYIFCGSSTSWSSDIFIRLSDGVLGIGCFLLILPSNLISHMKFIFCNHNENAYKSTDFKYTFMFCGAQSSIL